MDIGKEEEERRFDFVCNRTNRIVDLSWISLCLLRVVFRLSLNFFISTHLLRLGKIHHTILHFELNEKFDDVPQTLSTFSKQIN